MGRGPNTKRRLGWDMWSMCAILIVWTAHRGGKSTSDFHIVEFAFDDRARTGFGVIAKTNANYYESRKRSGDSLMGCHVLMTALWLFAHFELMSSPRLQPPISGPSGGSTVSVPTNSGCPGEGENDHQSRLQQRLDHYMYACYSNPTLDLRLGHY